jgi:Uma2 family endonuclease
MTILQKIPDRIPDELSLAEFLVWNAPGPWRWQLVEGAPEAMAPASPAHARIQSEIGGIIRDHLRKTRPGCAVLSNPGVLLAENDQRNFRIPDLGVTCTPDKPGDLSIQNPILLIEILSPSNEKETWLNVQAYTRIASVEEVLIFDSTKMEAENWRRFRDGTWHRKKFQYATEDVQFLAIQFSVRLSEIYEGTGINPSSHDETA